MDHKTLILATAALSLLAFPPVMQAATDQERLAILESRVDSLARSSATPGRLKQAHLHGYGELHYNNLSGEGGAADKEEIDFHRFVLLFGYEFTDRIHFISELELEHSLAGDGKPGEVELEQAFIDLLLTDNHSARAGLFLLPVGLLNTVHEPPRFYGVERNPVEKNIIPTTWWEGGLALHGYLGAGWNYEAAVHSGLNTSSGKTYSVRSGRQKVAEANASDPAGTLALSWSAPGVTLGGAIQYQSGITQGRDATAGHAWLGEIHTTVQHGPFGLRALYAEWALEGDGPESMGADRQYGWYIEPSYRITAGVGLFARYTEWDNQAGSGASASGKTQIDAGINWWPHEQVVFKADYQWQDNENGKDQNGVNLGVGYEF